jgi:hypothetical protein
MEANLVPRWTHSDRAVFDRDGSWVAQVRTAEDARRIAAAVLFAECVPTETLEAWTAGLTPDSAGGLAAELDSLFAASVIGQPFEENERRGGQRRLADRRRPSPRAEVAQTG